MRIWDGTYQNLLENHSELINTLMSSKNTSLIIYPSVLRKDIEDKIALERANL